MIHIGLINNMPDSALDATERQFHTLLCEAAEGLGIRLSLYAIPEISRSQAAREKIARAYSPLEHLWSSSLDGLIVTGAEPLTRRIQDESYWPALTRIIDWAGKHTTSSIFSCLAAQAAVLHLDGIERRPLPGKLCGIFECVVASDHPLTSGLPDRLLIPHSRWNQIPEAPLTSCGYRILTQSSEAGADSFLREAQSLFIFFQGHPEYDDGSLLSEYRRDMRRYAEGESAIRPALPVGYVNETTRITNTWRPAAVQFYRNWLQHLSAPKTKPRAMAAGLNYLARAAASASHEGFDGPL